MAKATVIKNYYDRLTGISYNTGAKVEYTDDRAAELAEKGFVKIGEKAVAVQKAEKKAAAKKTTKKK